MTSNGTQLTNHKHGQVLLFVLVATTIALVVGTAVANRSISSSARVTSADTYTRASAAAEGGIERLLTLSDTQLGVLASGANSGNLSDATCSAANMFNSGATASSDGKACVFTFSTGATGPGVIFSEATVGAQTFNHNGADEEYWFNLAPNMVKEVNLDGFTAAGCPNIRICWDNPKAAIYAISYEKCTTASDPNCDVKRDGYRPNSPDFSVSSTDLPAAGFTSVGINPTYNKYCTNPDDVLVSNAYGLRVKVLYDRAKVSVISTCSGVGLMLPTQGYKLISKGSLVSDKTIQATKTIVAYKSKSYMPSVFDYAVYTENALPSN